MRFINVLAAMTVFLVGALPLAANAQNIVVEGAGARAHSIWGGELGVGYNLRAGPVTLRPIGGVFLYAGDNDRFQNETFSNGNQICRDLSNGQFADDSDCNNTAAKLYGKVEGTVSVPLFAEIGAGARFSGERVRIYGTAAADIFPRIKLKANVGDRYVALGLMAGF